MKTLILTRCSKHYKHKLGHYDIGNCPYHDDFHGGSLRAICGITGRKLRKDNRIPSWCPLIDITKLK